MDLDGNVMTKDEQQLQNVQNEMYSNNGYYSTLEYSPYYDTQYEVTPTQFGLFPFLGPFLFGPGFGFWGYPPYPPRPWWGYGPWYPPRPRPWWYRPGPGPWVR